MADRIGATPAPEADPYSHEIRQRAEAGELCCLQCAKGCGVVDYAARICPRCAGPLEVTEARGDGLIYSFAVYHIQYTPEFDTPYTALFVELDEGCRIAAVLDDDNMGSPAIGDRVFFHSCTNGTARFTRLNDGQIVNQYDSLRERG